MYCVHQGLGNNGQLWLAEYVETETNWGDLPVPSLGISASPALTVRILAPGQQELHCAHQACGNNGQLAINVFDGYSHWSGDCQVPSVGLTDSPALAWYNGLLYCAHQGPGGDGQLWYLTFDGTKWAPDQQLKGATMSASPALCVYNGLLYCAFQGGGNSGELWYTTFDGTHWTPGQQVKRVGMSASPALCEYNGLLYCAHQGGGNNGQLWYTTFDGKLWAADQQININSGITDSPSLAVNTFNNQLMCAHQGPWGDNDNMLWYTTFDGKTWAEEATTFNVRISGSPSLCDYYNPIIIT